MPNLHVHYLNGNVKAFRQELDGTGGGNGAGGGGGGGGWKGPGSAGAGRSWTMNGMSGVPSKGDPNERDQFGRTVLHLAAGSLTQNAYTFLSILLRNQHISVNLQDYESGYTALHRALFVGNIKAARDLLGRHDIDPSIKDAEGLTAYDLYNGTVDGTNPPQDAEGTDLYVWGVNRNFTLGVGDSSDKAYPDRVNLLTQNQASGKVDPTQRFDHVGVKDVVMAKLHTGVVTTEARGNLSLSGFGSNGRLARTIHSQLALTPMPDLPHTVVSVALGQDHTLALTSGGYILSWGHNRFAQLGYPIEASDKPVGAKDDQEIQVSPKRIVGPLKKEFVKGVAAGRMSSACWTEDTVWTWGTNLGHLGYEKAANPVQILPRKVTTLSQTVVDVALSDYAMICLLDSQEVLCFHHDTNFKIGFSTPRILSDAFPFRPPQSTLKPMIRKVTSCGNTFAALSSIGDVFTFTMPNPLEDVSKEARDRHVTVKPQLIWALRKSFTAVKDVALGSDGTVIICTHSGHVFVRQRVKAGSGGLKFKRINYLQRVIKVAVNESGAFAAIRVDARPTPIALSGRTLEEDLFLLQPHFRRFEHQMTADDFDREKLKRRAEEDEEDEGSNSVVKDTAVAVRMCTILTRWRASDQDSLFSWSDSLLGSDLTVDVKGVAIPAHSTVLSLRCPALAKALSGGKVDRLRWDSRRRALHLEVCRPLVALLLLQYIYSDDVAAVWDARVSRALQDKFSGLKLPHAMVKTDLQDLARILDISPLSLALESAGKSPMTRKTLPQHVLAFFTSTATTLIAPPSCDITLALSDRRVACSSVILRARCPFFEAMFADRDWTLARTGEGNVVVHMEHLKWRPMNLVFRFIHEGLDDDLFDYTHQENLDAFLDFVFEVLAAATELLLDRLVLVCSRVIIRHCNVFNAAALACEATFYQATTLKLSIFDYIISSMETMLESGLLDEMYEDVLQDLCRVIAQKQEQKLSVSRSGVLVDLAMYVHREWLALQDIPAPRVRQPFKWRSKSPKLSPVDLITPMREIRPSSPSPATSPEMNAVVSTPVDDIFSMDDLSSPSTTPGTVTPKRPMTPLDLSARSSGKGPVWKPRVVEANKTDLRSIMAETAASSNTPPRPSATPSSSKTPLTMERRLPGASTTPTRPSATVTPVKTPSASTSGLPWRAIESKKASLTAVQQVQQGSSPASSSVSLPRPAGSQVSPAPARPTTSRIITPVKLQPTPPGVQRRVSQNAAWAASTTFAPPALPVITSPDARSFSLLAIQQEEIDRAGQVKAPAKTFAQIQDEERNAEQERAQEAEFMRWWQEEEARTAKETGGGASKGAGVKGGRGGPKGGSRRAQPRGRGGGGVGRGGRGGGPVAQKSEAGSLSNGAGSVANGATTVQSATPAAPSLQATALPFVPANGPGRS